MKAQHYADWVAKLEAQSLSHPKWYQAKVFLWVLLGFGLVAVLLGMSGLGVALLAGGVLWVVTAGPKALILLLKLGKLLLLLALPLGRMIWTGTRALFVRLPPPKGEKLLREEAPKLFEALDKMQAKLKGPVFHQVLLVDEMNAAVMQRPLFGWIGFPRNTLILGLPLLEALSAREALAVVAHEYGHLAAEHSRFGAYIYRLRFSWSRIQDVTFQWEGLTGRFMRWLVSLYAPAFNAYTFVLARAQEYEADRTGARLLGAEAMASALKRVQLAAAHEQQVYGQVWKRARQEATAPKDCAFTWAAAAPESCRQQDAPLWLGRALQRQADLLDTHPSLTDRLKHLRQGDEPPMPLRGPSAAETWLVKRLPAWRRHFSEAWAARTQPVWEERHAALQAQREQLRTLQGKAAYNALDQAEHLEMITLQEDLNDLFDAASAYASYNATYPDHPRGLFREGCARLAANDEQGLACLERCMALDPDATLAACEIAWRYLQSRDAARAQVWETRWRERQALLDRITEEFRAPDARQKVLHHGLKSDVIEAIEQVIDQVRTHCGPVYLLRRQLPAAPQRDTYVLLVQPAWGTRFKGRADTLVQALSSADWPVEMLVMAQDDMPRLWRRRLPELKACRLN